MMNVPITQRIVDTLRLIGSKRFTRLFILIGMLLILGNVLMVLRREHISRAPAKRKVISQNAVWSIERYKMIKEGMKDQDSTSEDPLSSANSLVPYVDKINDIVDGKYKEKGSSKEFDSDEDEYDMALNETNESQAEFSSTALTEEITTPGSSSKQQNKKQNTRSKETKKSKRQKEKFLIYLCDDKKKCYGLGDRQRAVASVYVLSILTDRTFGIIWTHPCRLTKFFQPNDLDWDIPSWKLNGKSKIELEFLGIGASINFNKSFNQQYPQDIIYMRTNQNFIHTIKESPIYLPHLPKWARGTDNQVTGRAWKLLMKPTVTIRQALNEMLVKIYLDQQLDDNIVRSMGASRVCSDACEGLRKYHAESDSGNVNRFVDGFDEKKFNRDSTVMKCLSELRKNATSLYPEGHKRDPNRGVVTWTNIDMFCKSKYFVEGKNTIANKKMNIETIQKAQDYDVVDLNLVCIHARVGKNPDMPSDPVRNSVESTEVLWDFARPYAEKGRHLYIATDYAKVREDSEGHFGIRSHSSNTPIVHIAKVQKFQNETEGMALALWEQLMLMTSCKTLVQSHSGFSILAGAIRHDLMRDGERFMFQNGKIYKKN